MNTVLYLMGIVIVFSGSLGIIIFVGYQRYKITNGIYTGLGQNMIFICSKQQNEIITLLESINASNSIGYSFCLNEGQYLMEIEGGGGLRRKLIIPLQYDIQFIQGSRGLYVVINLRDKKRFITSAQYEPEIYKIMRTKLGCVPKEGVV